MSLKSISIGILTFLFLLDGFIPPASLPPNGPKDSDRLGKIFFLHWIWHQSTLTQFLLSILGSALLVLIWQILLNRLEKANDVNNDSKLMLSKWDVTGIIMASLGWSLRQWSKRCLEQYFTYQISKPTTLIDDRGPYIYLVHPGYSGALIHLCGLLCILTSTSCRERGLTMNRLAGLGVVLSLIVLGILRRIHDEEELLLETFGDVWVSHASSRWRLFPFLY